MTLENKSENTGYWNKVQYKKIKQADKRNFLRIIEVRQIITYTVQLLHLPKYKFHKDKEKKSTPKHTTK